MPSFNNLDVSRKLPIFIVGFSLLAAAVTGGANYLSSRATLEDFAQTKMEIIVGERLERLTAWRDSMFSAIQVKSLNPAVIDATVAFTSAFAAVGDNPEKMLQDLYIHQSPHPIGEKQLLVNAEDGSNYSAVHEAYHRFFKAYQEDHGYYDLFLFDPSGNLVYSVFKELDYATNMINGQWASSGLARAFRDAIGAAQGAEPSFIGFEPYGPSADAPASFISQPIFDEGGVLVGVLAFQLPVDRLNSMMTTDPKSGKTADAFLVGSDGLMRSTSKFSDGSDLLNTRVEPAIADAAREGVKGSHIGEDRHGREVFASFVPLRIGNVEWLIVAEVETREAFAPIVEMRNNIIINILMISVIALIAGFLLARSLSRPLTRVGDAMEAVADRKFDNEIADVERKDEIGRIANVLASFREKLIAADELAIEAAYKSSGFEQSSEALLMFDMDMNVMYMNASAQKFFGTYEKEFSSYLPDFDIDGIRGSNLDLFPAKPGFQRDTFTDVDNVPYAGDIEVDGLQIGISANAIIDENQKQIGCVVRITEVTEIRTNAGIIDALRQDQIIVEYDLAGRVQAANDNFLNLVGMGIDDVVGADLVSFMDPRQVDIEQLSSKLKAGEFQSGKFLRKGAGDDIIWTQGAIAPIFNDAGQMVRFVEISTDVSEAEHFSFEAGKVLEAFSEKQAVISFTPDGQILSANDNLLSTMGYTEDEIIGAMHSKFMPEHERDTLDYRDHWAHLRRGDIVTGVFERINKDGDPVYLQASYTPITGYDGTVATIRKFATDITEQEINRRANAKIRETMEAELEKVVNALSLGLSKLSQGDLTVAISDQFPEAYEELRTDFNLTRQRLSEVVQDIVVTSGGIRNGAGEISHAADDLSRRTESQAAALEETVAALKQLTDSVQTAASDAEKADKFTATATENAKANEEIVRQSLGAMKKIEDSSDQISQIIGVIDDIAFQTNLLALNAGVEAARAGEAGRGFAVVASEVRALAQRCSDAAKEIKQLISTSTQQVEDGVKFVSETSTALEKIIHMVSEINTFVSNISTVSQEQATGVGEIMLAMDQLDGVTQKNAAMVEEMTAASHELTTDSKTLGGLVSRFQLSDTTDAPAAVDGPKPPVKTATASGTPAEPSPARAPTAPGPVAMPRTSGSAAVNIMAEADDDDWEDF